MTHFFAVTSLVTLFLVSTIAPASAQDTKEVSGYPVFSDYQEFRDTLDPLIKSRQVSQFMKLFGGRHNYNQAQSDDLQAKIRSVRPVDFINVEVIKSDNVSDNWHQELLAYWTGADYLFVYILYQQRDEGLFPISLYFNTDLKELLRLVM